MLEKLGQSDFLIAKKFTERRFGFSIGIVLFFVSIWPLFFSGTYRTWSGLLAMGLLGSAWLAPSWLTIPMQVWVKVTVFLAHVVNRILLGIAFFFVVTPIALFLRLLGRDILRLRWNKNLKSYWNLRIVEENNSEQMRYQF